MKKSVAIILPLLIISTAAFAQDPPRPSLKSIATPEETPAGKPGPESAVAVREPENEPTVAAYVSGDVPDYMKKFFAT